MAALHGAVFEEVHERGNDVIMVPHSWSGIVASGAVDGLGKEEREKNGEKGGVVKLAYISAFVPMEGVSLTQAFGGEPSWYDVKVYSYLVPILLHVLTRHKEPWVTPKTPEEIFYHDLPHSEAAYWSSKLRKHSYATLSVGASSAAWRTITSTYLICEDDRAIPVFVQEAMVKACQDTGADMKTERLFASHSPFLSKPDEVVSFLRRAAGEIV
jgi:pimeloyl-ACP methyl ester carboxylesterase